MISHRLSMPPRVPTPPNYNAVQPQFSDSDFSDTEKGSFPSYAAPRFPSQLPPPPGFPRSPIQDEKPHPFLMFLVRLVPIVATLAWAVTLIGLLIYWGAVDNAQTYKWYLGAMPYLSDIGSVHKDFFIAAVGTTAMFWFLSVFVERLLRIRRVLPTETKEKVLWMSIAIIDIIITAVGGVCLVLLACYDAFTYQTSNNIFTLTFVTAICISCLLQTLEVQHLWHDHPDSHALRTASVLKWIFVTIAISCTAAFLILYALCNGDGSRDEKCYKITTASAVMQWAACFLCLCYFFTLIIDVWPAYRYTAMPAPLPIMADSQSFMSSRSSSTRKSAPMPPTGFASDSDEAMMPMTQPYPPMRR